MANLIQVSTVQFRLTAVTISFRLFDSLAAETVLVQVNKQVIFSVGMF